MRILAGLLVALTLWLATPMAARACPTCADAVAAESGSDEVDQQRLATGYNRSIYLMLVVPYGALGFVGFLVYRQLRITEAVSRQGNLVEGE